MNTHRLGSALVVLIIFFLGSCTPNLEVRKKQGEASRNLGEAFYNQGNYTAALKEFIKAEKLYPQDPALHNDLGLTYKAKDKLDLSIKHFQKALELNPDYTPAKNNLGTVYLAKGEWDRAITYFKVAAGDVLYATPHFPLANLGLAYYNKGEYDLAEKYFRDALKFDPKFINALSGLGRTYIAMGKSSEAVATLRVCVKHYPRVPQLHYDLGEAHTLSRNYKEAFDSFQKVIELVPDTPLARKARIESQKIKNFR